MEAVGDGVWVVTAGTFTSNSYICRADVPGGAVLIDAGLDGRAIDEALAALGLRPAYVFCTHGHFDHLGSASRFQKHYGASVYLHVGDLKTAKTNNFLLMAMKLTERVEMPQLDLVEDGASFDLGGRTLSYRHAPGHTPGSCVIKVGEHLFTGDTLYARGVGLSKLPGEKESQLRNSIMGLWDLLDHVTIHPGHGPSAPGRIVKSTNLRLRAFLGLDASEEGRTAYAV